MSDLNALWQEYEQCSDLAQRVAADVIALKRVQFDLPGAREVTPQQLEQGRIRLRGLIAQVLAALESPQHSWWQQARQAEETQSLLEPSALSSAFIERLREQHDAVRPRFLEDLRELHERLAQPVFKPGPKRGGLSDEQLEVLESLSENLHQQTSHVFRRMWRK